MDIKIMGGPSDGDIYPQQAEDRPGDCIWIEEWIKEGDRLVPMIVTYHRTEVVTPEGQRIYAFESMFN